MSNRYGSPTARCFRERSGVAGLALAAEERLGVRDYGAPNVLVLAASCGLVAAFLGCRHPERRRSEGRLAGVNLSDSSRAAPARSYDPELTEEDEATEDDLEVVWLDEPDEPEDEIVEEEMLPSS
jgi:hypothetical protein